MVTGLESLTEKTVVVVDDNRAFLRLMRSILTEFGVKDIVDFDSAGPVISYLESHKVSALFLDLVMAGTNGLALAQEIRHAPKLRNRIMPIIMVTGHADVTNLQAAIYSGVDEMLVKPVRPRDIRDKLLSVIHQPRLYIKTRSGYFGPDRRRRQDPLYRGSERRLKNDVDVVTDAPLKAADVMQTRAVSPASEASAKPTRIPAELDQLQLKAPNPFVPDTASLRAPAPLPIGPYQQPSPKAGEMRDTPSMGWSEGRAIEAAQEPADWSSHRPSANAPTTAAPSAVNLSTKAKEVASEADSGMNSAYPAVNIDESLTYPALQQKNMPDRPLRSMGGSRFFLD